MSGRAPLAAIGLLTRVPVGGSAAPALAAAVPWFPPVGALTGLVVGVVLVAAEAGWPAYVAAVLAALAELLLTGGLHLDGLADTCDGAGGASRERRLAIMRDHAVGVYGAAAVTLTLLLRVGCLAALAERAPVTVLAATTAAWALSRAAILPVALLLPSARPEGTGRPVIEGITRSGCWIGVAAGVLVAAVCLLPVLGPAAAAVGIIVAAGAAVVPARWAATRLGGATGDVLGAVAELALTGALLGILAAA